MWDLYQSTFFDQNKISDSLDPNGSPVSYFGACFIPPLDRLSKSLKKSRPPQRLINPASFSPSSHFGSFTLQTAKLAFWVATLAGHADYPKVSHYCALRQSDFLFTLHLPSSVGTGLQYCAHRNFNFKKMKI